MSRRNYNIAGGGGVLPAGYAECEYLQSQSDETVGTTDVQYIDTGYSLSEEYIKFETKARWCLNGGSIIGSRSGSKSGFQTQRYQSKNCFRFFNGGTSVNSRNGTCQLYTDYELEVILDGSHQKLLFDGEVGIDSTNTSLTPIVSGLNIGLFACIRETIQSQSAIRIYYMKIYNSNGIIMRHYIPALRTADNKPGMYDLCESICPLTGTPFYINSGTGDFLYELK